METTACLCQNITAKREIETNRIISTSYKIISNKLCALESEKLGY